LLSTLTVTKSADSGPGSLRAEIAAASSGDTIVFSQKLNGQTITLTSGELVVNQSLNIDGLGAQKLSISGGGNSRVFDVVVGATVTLSGLTITAGTADVGGGIMNEAGATLYISQCALTGNQALGGASGNAQGGAIFNAAGANLSLSQSLLAGDQANALNLSFGGAIYNQGTATILASRFTCNQAAGSDTAFDIFPTGLGGNLGGAIMNGDGAVVTVSTSSFIGNEALGGPGGDALGGAIDNESGFPSATLGVTATVVNCAFTGNAAITGVNLGSGFQGGFGGAIEDLPGTTITVISSAFTGNQAIAMPPTTDNASSYADGGAIDNGAVSPSYLSINLTVDACSFTNNSASGGQVLAPGFGNFAYGGAVSWNLFGGIPGSVSFTDSSFIGNQAVGEPATDGVFGPGAGGDALGGAIFAGSALSATNCTLTNNHAVGGSADGRAGYAEGGAIDASGGLTVTNCILTGNQAIGGSGDGITGYGAGGAIDASGGFTAIGCILIGNEAIGGSGGSNARLFVGYADGGGINVFGTAAITTCVLVGNQAIGGSSSAGLGGFAVGGGISGGFAFATTTLTLQGSTLTGNAAIGGQGGPGSQGGGAAGGGIDIELFSSADVIGSTLKDNSATGGPGGSGGSGGVGLGGGVSIGFFGLLESRFDHGGSSLSLSASTVSGNQAHGGAGESGGNGGNALGGGIAVDGEDIATIGDSDLESNSARGGDGRSGGNGGNGFGGGLYVDSDSSTGVSGSTITRNHAVGGHGNGGGGDGQGIGGGVYYLGTFTFDNATTISKNHASTSNDDIFP